MSKLPVASAFGSTDVVEMQPFPSPADLHKFSSAAVVQHVLGDGTNAIWIHVPQGADGLLGYEGVAAEADDDASWPIPAGVRVRPARRERAPRSREGERRGKD